MRKKKIILGVCFIVLLLILIGALAIYKRHEVIKESIANKNNKYIQEYDKVIKVTDNGSMTVSITHDNINIGMDDVNKDNNYKGQLLEKQGVSKDEFINTKYPGISDKLANNQESRVVIRYYNPNVLTQKTLVDYYNNVIKANTTPDITQYYLLDVYNKNYAIGMSSHENGNNEFNVGNVDSHCTFVNNDNLIYCGIKGDGIITAYSINGKDSGKPVPFILKK